MRLSRAGFIPQLHSIEGDCGTMVRLPCCDLKAMGSNPEAASLSVGVRLQALCWLPFLFECD